MLLKNVCFDNIVSIADEEIPEEISDNELTETFETNQEDICDSGDYEEVMETEETIKLNDAINALNCIRKYNTSCNGSEKCYQLLNQLENEIYLNRSKSLKQSKITDFLSK